MNKQTCTRWAFDLSNWKPTLTQLAQAVAAVQLEERTRLEKFYFIDDFLSSLVGRLLMRKYVSEASSLNYFDVQFARDERGKPYWQLENITTSELTKLPQLSFNVSHQGKFVVLAGVAVAAATNTATVQPTFGVGTDVMKIEYSGGKPLKEFFRIMQRKFSHSEWCYIQRAQHNEIAQLKAFMRHWCLKEAFVKELGVGITIDLEKISFTVDANTDLTADTQPLTQATLRFNDKPMLDWHFEEHLLATKYCAAIAFRNIKPEKQTFIFLNIEELLFDSEKAKDQQILDYCTNVLRKPTKS